MNPVKDFFSIEFFQINNNNLSKNYEQTFLML